MDFRDICFRFWFRKLSDLFLPMICRSFGRKSCRCWVQSWIILLDDTFLRQVFSAHPNGYFSVDFWAIHGVIEFHFFSSIASGWRFHSGSCFVTPENWGCMIQFDEKIYQFERKVRTMQNNLQAKNDLAVTQIRQTILQLDIVLSSLGPATNTNMFRTFCGSFPLIDFLVISLDTKG